MLYVEKVRRVRTTGGEAMFNIAQLWHVVKDSMAHSNNPGVLNQTPHLWWCLYQISCALTVASLAVSMTTMLAKSALPLCCDQ